MEQPVETKVLWAIEKEAKLLIFPLFEPKPEPATSETEKKEEAVNANEPVFKLSLGAEENYAFFIANRIGTSEEAQVEFEKRVNFLHQHLPEIDKEKIKVVALVFMNYTDICGHFYRSLYPEHAEALTHSVSYTVNQHILAAVMMMHTKETAQSQLNSVNHHLKILQQIGDGNEKQAATAMKVMNPYEKVFMYLAHQLAMFQHKQAVYAFADEVDRNNQLLAQLNQLGKILAGVLGMLNDEINP